MSRSRLSFIAGNRPAAFEDSMQKRIMKRLSTDPLRSRVYLSFLISLKIVSQLTLFSRGFISVSADEFARGIRAAEWALQPRFDILADVKEIWLPLEKYLNGLLLLVWPDVIRAPRVTVFVASCLVLIALFVFVYYLFNNFQVAALASAFVVFQPWYAWLSGTPMLEMYYLACFLGGLVFLTMWLREERRGYWFWAGCCFMLASCFHVQSWIFINVVNLITVSYLGQYIRQKRFGYLWRLIGFYVLGNLFIITVSIVAFLDTGQLFAFLANHTSYSKWFYGGYNVSVLEKLLYYPKLLIQNSSGAVWLLLSVALVVLLRDKANKWKWFPLTLAVAGLSINSAMNVVSGPPSAAPGRYSLFYVIMISPYLAYGTYHLWVIGRLWMSRWMSRIGARALAVLATGLFLYSVWWGIVRIPDFPQGMSMDAVETGYYLNQVLSDNGSNSATNYLVELKYWDFLAIKLTAGHYDTLVFDREYNLFNRDTPSIFSGGKTEVSADLRSQNIVYVALRDPDLKANARRMGFLRAMRDVGNWTVYEFKPEP
jgi:hypothetical protein